MIQRHFVEQVYDCYPLNQSHSLLLHAPTCALSVVVGSLLWPRLGRLVVVSVAGFEAVLLPDFRDWSTVLLYHLYRGVLLVVRIVRLVLFLLAAAAHDVLGLADCLGL